MNTQSTKPELDERFSVAAQNWLLATQERPLQELLARGGKVREKPRSGVEADECFADRMCGIRSRLTFICATIRTSC